MTDWAKKILISAILIGPALVLSPSIPEKDVLAVVGPLFTGTAWHFASKYEGLNEKTESDTER